jgi:transposase
MEPMIAEDAQPTLRKPLAEYEKVTIFYYAGMGWSMDAIARILNRDPSTIYRNFNKLIHLIPGTAQYTGIMEPSQPESPDQLKMKKWPLHRFLLFSILDKPSVSVRSLAREMQGREFCFAVRKSQINDEYKTMKIHPRNVIKRPRMSPKNIEYRKTFAQQIWQDVKIFLPWLFTDEVSIDRNGSVRSVRRVPHILSDQDIYVERDQFPCRIMVWGAIGFNFKSALILVNGSIDALQYQAIIAQSGVIAQMDALYGVNCWVFQDDGASPHRAKSTRQFLAQQCLTLSSNLHWPAHSPDLNVIENVWAIMKSEIGQCHCETPEDLWRVAQEAWEHISIELVNNLIASFQYRLQCVQALGGQSLNGHREVQQMLSTGKYTIEQIIEMRKQESRSLLEFKCYSWDFFRDQLWVGKRYEEMIHESMAIVQKLPEPLQCMMTLTNDQ